MRFLLDLDFDLVDRGMNGILKREKRRIVLRDWKIRRDKFEAD